MKHFFNFFILIFLSIFSLCTTRDGVINSNPDISGAVSLTLSVDTAVVFINNSIVDTVKNGETVITNVVGTPKNIILFSPGYAIIDTVIGISDGETTTVDANFQDVSNGVISIKTVEGASIYMDNLCMGKVPDSVFNIYGVEIGSHIIYVTKGTATSTDTVTVLENSINEISPTLKTSKFILIEHFSNVSCEGCPEKAEILMNIIDSIGSLNIVKLSHSAYWPSTQDPMYLAAKDDNHTRIAYYKVALLPYFVINGVSVNYTSNDELHNELVSSIGSEFNKVADFSIEVKQVSSDSGTVVFSKLSGAVTTPVARVALEQELQSYSSAPGNNGEKNFYNVFRGYANGENGTLLDFSNKSEQKLIYKFDTEKYSGEDLYLIAFLQDDSTKEILQTIKVKLN